MNDFDKFYNTSLINKNDSFIFSENDKKIFSKIEIETFILDIKNTNYINNHNITIDNLRDFFDGKERKSFDNIVFRDCKINKLNIKTINLRNVFFENCEINEVEIKDCNSEDLLKLIKFDSGIINYFKIINSIFKNNLHINHNSQNKLEIVDLNISSCIFEKDFSFHNVIIKNAEIKDCDFNSLSEFIDSKFTETFNFDEITYKGFTLFDNCTFNAIAKFKYVIFEKFTSFRGSKFNKGIDLEYTSNDKEINFYGIEILDKTTTSQETYRIIKNQFEKLNNKIEANKYHALELVQRKKELEKDKWKYFSEYLVFIIHDLSSKHSTSWFRAVLWIIFIGFFTIFLVHFDIVKDLFFHPSNFKIAYLSKIWSEFWQYINITNLEKLKDNPFILFLNKLSLGYLYYQFLTAVRKDTRK